MKKQITTIILGIMFLGLASALFAGDCQEVQLDFTNLDNVAYTTINNQSNLEGLNVSINGNLVSICPVINYKPDNFTIIFWDNTPEVVVKEVIVHHGGGSHTKIVYENITELVPFETIKYLNQTIEVPAECPEVEQKVGFFKRIWNWIRELFK